MKPAAAVLAALAAAFLLAGCGEKEQVTVYKQGKYQGKKDELPYAGEKFGGNKAEWEKAIVGRNQNQNEYLRTTGGG